MDEDAPCFGSRGDAAARAPGPVRPGASAVVRAYLDAMESRDLGKAESFVGEGFAMTFPGGVRFTDLASMVAWSKSRYRFVRKVYEPCEEVLGDPDTVVWCRGTLRGEWPDGAAFEAIRFVDRFVVRGGKIVDQMVWNDLAESLRR